MIALPRNLKTGRIFTVRKVKYMPMRLVLFVAILSQIVAHLYDVQASEILSDPLSKIEQCLREGKETILFASKSPECVKYMTGREKLDALNVEQPNETNYKNICDKNTPETAKDQRVLAANIIKILESRIGDSIDSAGYRIIGGIYCEGLDLRGLHTDRSIVLDRSVFVDIVDLRNFKSEADFSVDYSALYRNLYIIRASIEGSVYAQFAFMRRLTVGDSKIEGAIRLKYSTVYEKLGIESVSLGGDADLSHAYYSYAVILKNKISGTLDLGQSQSRCFYDIRNNEFGSVIMTNFGFGGYANDRSKAKLPLFSFESIIEESSAKTIKGDPLDQHSSPKSFTQIYINNINKIEPCKPYNSVAPGSIILVDNRVKNSFCLRSPRWLKSSTEEPAQSHLYFNENSVDGAIWIDFTDRFTSANHSNVEASKAHIIRMFNINTGTLIINFDFVDKQLELKINGLMFKRIYNSAARCEASVSMRADKPIPSEQADEFAKTTFPPDLTLPSPNQVLQWIQRNSFKATQPFAEFVSAFEQAGDLSGARDLKVSAAELALKKSMAKLSCLSCFVPDADAPTSQRAEHKPSSVATYSQAAALLRHIKDWAENLAVVIFMIGYGWLADFGFRPEQILWFVTGTLILSVLIFHTVLKIVGFSVINEPARMDPVTWRPIVKIHPVGFIFLFDHLLPAYKIRSNDYNVSEFFVRSRTENGQDFSYFGVPYKVEKASPGKARKAERFLNIIRFLGLLYAVFVLAAVSKIVR